MISMLGLCLNKSTVASEFSAEIEKVFFSSTIQPIHFTNTYADESFPNPSVYDITQDGSGFIWFATQDGLYRYDGIKIKQFGGEFGKEGSLKSNWINQLHVDQQGRLWVASDKGIYLFYPEDETFKEFSQHTYPEYIKGGKYDAMAEDQFGNMWFAGKVDGISYFDVTTNTFKLFTHFNQATDKPKSIGTVTDILTDKDHNVLVATDGNGLLIKTPSEQEFHSVSSRTKMPFPSNNLRKLFEDNVGVLWVATYDDGLYQFDLNLGVSKKLIVDGVSPIDDFSNYILSIYQSSDDLYWLGTNKGLVKLNLAKKTIDIHKNENDRITSLLDERIYSVFQDKGGVLWVGTGTGVSRWNADLNRFAHISSHYDEKLSNDLVSSFSEDKNQNLYIGTWGGGVNVFDTITQNVISNELIDDLNARMEDNRIGSILYDSKDNLWVGTVDKGLYLLNAENQVQTFKHDENIATSLSRNSITYLSELQDGTIAIATYGGGLNLYLGEGKFDQIQISQLGAEAVLSNTVFDIEEDDDNNLWLATDAGVKIYNRHTNMLTDLNSKKTAEQRFASDTAYSILNTDKYIWIATQDAGIARINKRQFYQGYLSINYVSRNNGLVSNAVYGLVEGEKGFIWASHSRGLSRVHPEEISVLNFNATHNLQGLDFHTGAYFKDSKGRMYFGGANGFNAFTSDQIPLNAHEPTIRLLQFSKFNEPVPIKSVLNPHGELVLNYSDSVIGFEFAALDYTQPNNNKYKYQMLGLSDRWVNLNENRITFSNLTAGEYQLRVNGTNNDGIWSSEDLVLNILVNPPLWNTWYAKLLYVVIGLVLIYLFYNHQRRNAYLQQIYQTRLESQVKLRTNELQQVNNDLAVAIIETESAKDAAEQAAKAKADFLATMSHEIRTPMNSILGMSEILLKTDLTVAQKKYAKLAYQSGENLLALINDILDFSKMEVNKIQLENIEFELPALIEECIYLLSVKVNNKYLTVETDISIDCPRFIKGDALRIRQILTNLVSNAIKFTETGRVTTAVDYNDGCLRINVIDSGIGIEGTKLSHIFDVFEQADSSTTRKFGGTGLGLSISKNLVELMGGTISVTSEMGKGSNFEVIIPIENTATITPIKSSENAMNLQDFNAELMLNANVGLIASDKILLKQTKQCLQRLQLNYQQINKPENVSKFFKNNENDVLLVENSFLVDPAWQEVLSGIENRLICIGGGNSNGANHPKVTCVNGEVNVNDLYDRIAVKVADGRNLGIDKTSEPAKMSIQFNARILLVEDSYTNQIVATEMLTMCGCEVDVAQNGLQAISFVKEKKYDLVFMDCQMPVMDGFEATRNIRLWQERTSAELLIIVALTAGKGVGYLEECLGVGMDDFMLKPFNFAQLQAILQKYLGHLVVAKSHKTSKPIDKATIIAQEPSNTEENQAVIDNFIDGLVDETSLSTIFDIEKNSGKKIYNKVLEMFQMEMDVKLPELLKEYDSNNSHVVAHLAHSMKSLSANSGALKLAKMCQKIEKTAKSNELPLCETEVSELAGCYRQTITKLKDY